MSRFLTKGIRGGAGRMNDDGLKGIRSYAYAFQESSG
jgi:hypothetical protein